MVPYEELKALVAECLKASGGEERSSAPDQLLTAEAAAKLLATTPRWLYSNADKLKIAVRLPGRMVRFSSVGIARYIAKQTGR